MPEPVRTLPRTLNTVDLVLLGIGTVLGSGIFLVPSSVLNQSGGALGIALIVWVAAGILSVLGALTYGELGAMKPEAGGIYVYIRDAFGPFLAFLYGWALFFVIGSGSVATLTVAFTAYLQEFVALGAGTRGATRIAAESANASLGSWAAKGIAAAILVSMFSASNGLTLTTPRVYFAMARDGLFFERLARLHPRYQTPAFAVVTSSIWAALLAVTGTYEQLLTYVIFAAWFFYAFGGIAVFHYRRAHPDAHRPFVVPGYPVTPILFILSAIAIVVNTIVTQPARAAVGLGILLAGTPAYFLWRKRAVVSDV